MTEIRTHIDIDAPTHAVWSILTDFSAYSDWNPFISRLEGELTLGAKLEADVGGMVFKPTVIELDEGRCFAWLGRTLIPGLLDGEHHYELEALPNGGTRFHHYERFTGALLPFLKKTLIGKAGPGFEAMNQALEARAEACASRAT